LVKKKFRNIINLKRLFLQFIFPRFKWCTSVYSSWCK
jgi:hypothetical protein